MGEHTWLIPYGLAAVYVFLGFMYKIFDTSNDGEGMGMVGFIVALTWPIAVPCYICYKAGESDAEDT